MSALESRSFLLIAIFLAMAPAAGAQESSPPPQAADYSDSGFVTLLTAPRDTRLRLHGRARMRGTSPLEIPSWMVGRTSVLIEGTGVARTQGVIYLPEHAGDRPRLASEPPGMSAGLFVRSLKPPGVPDISASRTMRGAALAVAGAGAGFGAARAHFRYRDRLGESGAFAADRAEDERHERNGWFLYGLVVWGASAVDYWIRPRFEFEDTDPAHATLAAPPVTRAGAAWRSVLVPGAGQEFGNHSARGTAWLGAFLAAGAGFTIADAAVHRNQTKLDWARVLVDSAGPAERVQRLRDVESRRNDLQTTEDLRRGFRMALLGIYAANVIDVLVMPLRRAPAAGAPRLSATFPVGPERVGVALHVRF